jgi:hypothetical protein
MKIPAKITELKEYLFSKNQKSLYLAILRIAVSLYVLKDLAINWSSFDILYSNKSFVFREDAGVFSVIPGGIAMVRDHYMVIVTACIICCLLNIAGIGRWLTALLLFLAVNMLHRLNVEFVNGGDMMLRFILLYMIFANSYDHFVVYRSKPFNEERQRLSNLVSNLAAYSLMIELCVAYFCSGNGKLHNELWMHGQAVYYSILADRFRGTPFNTAIAHIGWLMIGANYCAIVFELGFPFLVWIKKIRKQVLSAGVLFHLFIYIFLMIYGFEIVFLLIYGLFFSNEEVEVFVRKASRKVRKGAMMQRS